MRPRGHTVYVVRSHRFVTFHPLTFHQIVVDRVADVIGVRIYPVERTRMTITWRDAKRMVLVP
jgi:hypothetical protein